MPNDLTTSGGRSAFEQRVNQLLGSGAVEDAWTEVVAHMANYPSLAEVESDKPRIDAWDEVAADCLEADERFERDGCGSAMSLTISLNRDDNTGAVELYRSLQAERPLGGEGPLREWHPGWERTVTITGMEAIAKLWRNRHAMTPEERLLIDHIALVQAHRVVDAALVDRGLPCPLTVVIKTHSMGRCEPGEPIPLPWASRQAPRPALMDRITAAAMIERRMAENAVRFQEMVGTMLAEYREWYRLIRLFPFYRAAGRKKLGDMLNSLLHTMCESQGLPTRGVGWRMSPRAFEALLRTYVAKRGVRDIEATLSTERVDALHVQWLHAARSCDFDLPKQPMSLFGINMTWGLTFGGPIVKDRWERLKAFDPEKPTAISWVPEPVSG